MNPSLYSDLLKIRNQFHDLNVEDACFREPVLATLQKHHILRDWDIEEMFQHMSIYSEYQHLDAPYYSLIYRPLVKGIRNVKRINGLFRFIEDYDILYKFKRITKIKVIKLCAGTINSTFVTVIDVIDYIIKLTNETITSLGESELNKKEREELNKEMECLNSQFENEGLVQERFVLLSIPNDSEIEYFEPSEIESDMSCGDYEEYETYYELYNYITDIRALNKRIIDTIVMMVIVKMHELA